MQDEIVRIFRNILLICEKEGLLGSTSFSLDGLKLPANASKDNSGTFADDPKAEYTNLDCVFTSKGDAVLT
jgi:hypothetical protein